MKQILLLFLSCVSHIGFAQSQFGFKAGFSLSGEKITSKPTFGVDNVGKSILGINGGFYAEFKRSESVSFQPEFIIRNGGYNAKNTNLKKERFRFYYADFPLLIKYYLHDYNNIKLFFLGGPYLGMIADYKYITNYGDGNEYDVGAQLNETNKKIEKGLILSLGGKRKTPIGEFSLELRWMRSIGNIYTESFGAKGNSHSVGFQLAYMLDAKDLLGPR